MLSPSRRVLAAVGTAGLLLLTTACGGGSGGSSQAAGGGASSDSDTKSSPVKLQLMIASSGDAETKAVQDAAAAWGQKTGNSVEVIPAKDINQQLTQALAGGTPPDLFYTDAARFPTLAQAGSLAAYGDKVQNADDFYAPLKQTFTYDGKFYCAPKDFSTLALEINTSMWKAAGLTDADIPTTWDQLAAVAKKLTTKDHVGLAIGDTRDRVGAFMTEAGGWFVNQDGTKVTADAPENLTALQYVQGLLKDGSAKYPKQLDAGWSGEAFGKQKAAMTIEGNWIQGAMKSDFPSVKYQTVELPAGPKGKGTLTFTQCWGMAAKSKNQAAAIDFVNFLTSGEQQLKFADEFGVMPSRQSVKDQFISAHPDAKAFVEGGAYAQGPVGIPGWDAVLADFDSQLPGLANGSTDPKKLLESVQKNGEQALNG
ncbi:MAG: sugar ABC transporter substrate-binding protein [Motilibacteraceae bacterium]